MKKIINLFVLAFIVMISNITYAGTVTGTQKATATLVSTCKMSAIDINFGDITSPVTITAAGNLAVLCSNNLAYTIGISLGANTGGVNRYLKGPKTTDLTDTIYFICRTNAFNDVAKTCTGGMWTTTAKVSGVGSGANQDIPVYAFIKGGLYVPDDYTDTVVATISY